MLDPEAAVAWSMRRGDAVVDVEHQRVRLSRRWRARRPAARLSRRAPIQLAERILRRHQQPGGRRVVLIGLEEERGGGAERAIHVPLHPRQSHPVIARSMCARGCRPPERQSDKRGKRATRRVRLPRWRARRTPAYSVHAVQTADRPELLKAATAVTPRCVERGHGPLERGVDLLRRRPGMPRRAPGSSPRP